MLCRASALAALAAVALAVPTAHRKLQADAGWTVDPNFSATLALAVAFDTPTSGIVVGGDDGLGAAVYYTRDGGATFGRASFGDDMPLLLLGGCVLRADSVVTGALASYQSADAYQTYGSATGTLGSSGQHAVAAVLPNNQPVVIITGESIFGGNGIQISRDGGASFGPTVPVFEDGATRGALARYTAVAGNTWYVAGGRFPTTAAGDDSATLGPGEALRQLTEHVRVRTFTPAGNNRSAAGYELELSGLTRTELQARRLQGGDGYTAAIAKSTDAGATWETIYLDDTSGQYFNQITCFDAERCAVVSEGGGLAQIVLTENGGVTWRPIFTVPDGGGSLAAIQVVGEGEAWAGGGTIGLAGFEARFYHTVDYGSTWREQILTNLGIVFDLSFPPGSPESGFATILGQSGSGLARYNAPEQQAQAQA